MHNAAVEGHNGVIDLLYDAGAAVDARSDFGTPLFRAAVWGHADVVKLLLNLGPEAETVDDNSETPLFNAVRGGHQAIVEILLEKGAQVNITAKNGRTPLSWAVLGRRESIVRLLLEHGADPDSVTDDDISFAAKRGYHSVLKVIRCAKEGKPLPPADQTPHNQMETVIPGKGRQKIWR